MKISGREGAIEEIERAKKTRRPTLTKSVVSCWIMFWSRDKDESIGIAHIPLTIIESLWGHQSHEDGRIQRESDPIKSSSTFIIGWYCEANFGAAWHSPDSTARELRHWCDPKG